MIKNNLSNIRTCEYWLNQAILEKDAEAAHLYADASIIILLENEGYGEIVKLYKKVNKKY